MDILVHSSAHSSICEPVRLLDKPREVIMMTMLLLFFVVKAAGNPLGRKKSRRRCGVVCTWSGLFFVVATDGPISAKSLCRAGPILLQLSHYNFCSAKVVVNRERAVSLRAPLRRITNIHDNNTPISRYMGNDLKTPTIILRR